MVSWHGSLRDLLHARWGIHELFERCSNTVAHDSIWRLNDVITSRSFSKQFRAIVWSSIRFPDSRQGPSRSPDLGIQNLNGQRTALVSVVWIQKVWMEKFDKLIARYLACDKFSVFALWTLLRHLLELSFFLRNEFSANEFSASFGNFAKLFDRKDSRLNELFVNFCELKRSTDNGWSIGERRLQMTNGL